MKPLLITILFGLLCGCYEDSSTSLSAKKARPFAAIYTEYKQYALEKVFPDVDKYSASLRPTQLAIDEITEFLELHYASYKEEHQKRPGVVSHLKPRFWEMRDRLPSLNKQLAALSKSSVVKDYEITMENHSIKLAELHKELKQAAIAEKRESDLPKLDDKLKDTYRKLINAMMEEIGSIDKKLLSVGVF
jgi:hypothetical protein